MIGHLRGVILERRPPLLVLEAAGVGYEVEAPLSTFYDLPPDGSEITLHMHLVVREDAQLLFGFRHRSERDLFRSLIKVNGVGPKLALTLLSGVEPREFVRCVQDGDVATLVKLPGVGRKTAERLVVEMRDRLAAIFGDILPPELDGAVAAAAPASSASRITEEAEGALITLGYKPTEAARAINAAYEDGLSTEEVIRRALRSMVSG